MHSGAAPHALPHLAHTLSQALQSRLNCKHPLQTDSDTMRAMLGLIRARAQDALLRVEQESGTRAVSGPDWVLERAWRCHSATRGGRCSEIEGCCHRMPFLSWRLPAQTGYGSRHRRGKHALSTPSTLTLDRHRINRVSAHCDDRSTDLSAVCVASGTHAALHRGDSPNMPLPKLSPPLDITR